MTGAPLEALTPEELQLLAGAVGGASGAKVLLAPAWVESEDPQQWPHDSNSSSWTGLI